MDIVFAVTGKAGKNGHEQWGEIKDENLSTRIYTHSKREASETSRLEIELRELQGERYSYYTYLIVKNVAQVRSKEDEANAEKHGRTGSFFGMTIRIREGYITDIPKLYSLFEQVFENSIKETILTDKDTNGYLTYLIDKLADGENYFALAEQDLLSNISSADIRELPTNCVTQQHRIGEIKHFNVDDAGHSTFFSTLFNDAEINVSREYDTIVEIEEKKRREIEEQKKREAEKQKDNEKKPLANLSETKVHRKSSSAVKDELKNQQQLRPSDNNARKLKNYFLQFIVYVVIFAMGYFLGKESKTESSPDTAHEEEHVVEDSTSVTLQPESEAEEYVSPKVYMIFASNEYNLRENDDVLSVISGKKSIQGDSVEFIGKITKNIPSSDNTEWALIVYQEREFIIACEGLQSIEK